jgi:putative chitinase
MTPEQLRAATGCTETLLIAFAAPIAKAISRWNVKRVPEFLAQISVESSKLSRLQESLFYTTPERLMNVWPSRFPTRDIALQFVRQPQALANYVYQGRMGNVQPGDGWRFRGRGLKQLTGRANYQDYQLEANVPVLTNPDMLLDPTWAADSAGWFWNTRKCDSLADDLEQLTRKINGGLTGLDDRRRATSLAREAFSA